MQYVSWLLLLFVTIAHADPRTKVAVIDTGISELALFSGYFCKDGHADMTMTGLRDRHGHGTMVANEIAKNLDKSTHCILVIKWLDYSQESAPAPIKLKQLVASINYAIALDAKFINLSLGGDEPYTNERNAIATALNKGIVVAVAAGNENSNLSIVCDYFPACYGFKNKNFIVVANYNGLKKQPSSNYGGPVTAYEYGPNGTSQSTAIYLGKFIRGLYENKCTNTCPAPRRMR